MDYIDYGMQVFKLEDHCIAKTTTISNYILAVEENKLNKIDIVGFFSQRKTRKKAI
jgi:hypothetical protein